MNKRTALNLKLSEEEFLDDKGREYKTYIINEVEYKLYADLNSRRLDGELPEEYKVRRYFIQAYSNKPPTMVWFSTNKDSLKWYNIARSIKNEAYAEQINTMKERAIMSNLGTYDKKKLQKMLDDEN